MGNKAKNAVKQRRAAQQLARRQRMEQEGQSGATGDTVDSAAAETDASQATKRCTHLLTCQPQQVRKAVSKGMYNLCEMCLIMKGGAARSKSKSKNQQQVDGHSVWMCTVCGKTGCGRSDAGHAKSHAAQTRKHALCVNVSTMDVWCYACDSEVTPTQKPLFKKLNACLDMLQQGRDGRVKGRGRKQGGARAPAGPSLDSLVTMSNADPGDGVRGLRNLGNTCYFNSVMQNLNHLRHLRAYLFGSFLAHARSNGGVTSDSLKALLVSRGKVTRQLYAFATCMWKTADTSAFSPAGLRAALTNIAPQFKGGQQQDSHEMLRCLLDGVHMEEGQRLKSLSSATGNQQQPVTFIQELFCGSSVSLVTCHDCEHTSVVYESFYDLSLELPFTKRKGGHDGGGGGRKGKGRHARTSNNPFAALQDGDEDVDRFSKSNVVYRPGKPKPPRVPKKQWRAARHRYEAERKQIEQAQAAAKEAQKDSAKEEGDGDDNTDSDNDEEQEEVDDSSSPDGDGVKGDENDGDGDVGDAVAEDTTSDGNAATALTDADGGRDEDAHELTSDAEPTNATDANETSEDGHGSSDDHEGDDAASDNVAPSHNSGEKSGVDGPIDAPRDGTSAKDQGDDGKHDCDDEDSNASEGEWRGDHDEVASPRRGAPPTATDDMVRVGLEKGIKDLFEGRNGMASPPQASSDGDGGGLTLQACLRAFTDPEKLHQDNAFGCSWCTKHGRRDGRPQSKAGMTLTTATKQLLLARAPRILTLHLKRFRQTARGRLDKVSSHVKFPMTLNLQQWLADASVHRHAGATAAAEDATSASNACYHLNGVVVHSGGSLRAGHYVAYVRTAGDPSGPPDQSTWHYFSDTQKRRVSVAEVLRAEAYLLFYVRAT